MSDMSDRLQAIEKETQSEIERAETLEALREIESRVLGRKGSLTSVLRGLKDLDPAERKQVGASANQIKNRLSKKAEEKRSALEKAELDERLRRADFDPTEPGRTQQRGHYHPVARTARELAQVFTSMGFAVVDGPEVETEDYNFEALNIPSYHPARDLQDTFWLKDGSLLRTHTSPVQIRALRRIGAPLRVVAPGRVFRYETQDASHEHTFHQIEGLVVDEGISVAHLKGVLKSLLSELFESEVTVRLRPHYFPFVEPGFELDFQCLICSGKGCPTCKGTGWIELLGCGMVHPNVLRSGGVDPEKYTGFAFGMGVERLAMMKYQIPDIRYFMSGDVRFFSQF